MKKHLLAVAIMMLFVALTNSAVAQSATIHKVWIEHGVSYRGEQGMKVHAKVSVSGLKGKNIRMIAFSMIHPNNIWEEE